MKKLHSKKGYTLAELIIIIAVVVLVVGAVATMLVVGGRMFKQTTDMSDSISQSSLVEKWLQNGLSVAKLHGIDQNRVEPVSDDQIALYFDGVNFCIKSVNDNPDKPTTMTLNNIQSVTLDFRLTNKHVTAAYTIISKTGRTMTGSVVMNNVIDITGIELPVEGSNPPSTAQIILTEQNSGIQKGILISKQN